MCRQLNVLPLSFSRRLIAEDDIPYVGQWFSWCPQSEGRKKQVTKVNLVLSMCYSGSVLGTMYVLPHSRCPSISGWTPSPGHQPPPSINTLQLCSSLLQLLLGFGRGGSLAIATGCQYRRAVRTSPQKK